MEVHILWLIMFPLRLPSLARLWLPSPLSWHFLTKHSPFPCLLLLRLWRLKLLAHMLLLPLTTPLILLFLPGLPALLLALDLHRRLLSCHLLSREIWGFLMGNWGMNFHLTVRLFQDCFRLFFSDVQIHNVLPVWHTTWALSEESVLLVRAPTLFRMKSASTLVETGFWT